MVGKKTIGERWIEMERCRAAISDASASGNAAGTGGGRMGGGGMEERAGN